MKEIAVALWELSRDEVKRLDESMQVLVYNKLTQVYFLEYATKKCIANYKYATDNLVYFTFEEPKFKEEV